MALAAERVRYVAAQHGRRLDRSRWSAVSPMHLAPTEEQARAEVRFGLSQHMDYVRQILPAQRPGRLRRRPPGRRPAPGRARRRGHPGHGDRHIERMQQLSGGSGTFLIEHADWADHRRTRASMELFAREVVPHVTGACRPRLRARACELGHDQLTRRRMAKAQAVADLEHAREVRGRSADVRAGVR